MKRDGMYYAREDVAFNAWLDPRKPQLVRAGTDAMALHHLVRSAFLSGVRFGSDEAEIQELLANPKAGSK